MTERPQQYRFHQGDRVLPFATSEYDARIAGLREIMEVHGVDACVFTSMHNIAYYSGFLYCSFGRPYGLVVTPTQSVTRARRPLRRPNLATGIDRPSGVFSENGSSPQSPSVLLGRSQHELAPDIDRSSADRIGNAILGVQTIPETMFDLV